MREMVHAIAFRAGVLERILQEPVYGGLEVRMDELAHVQLLQRQIDDLRRYLSLPSAEPEQIIKIGRRSGKTLEFAINYLQSAGWLQEHDRILTESAEPERKKGEWVRYEAPNGIDCGIQCSKCGYQSNAYDPGYGSAYCPNCGADMRGDDENA